DGYIIVNFEIQTIKNQDFSQPILGYANNTNCNMWQMEGGQNVKKDSSNLTYSLEDGDVVFYYANKKSSDDYSSGANR
ncbi:MAG: hypothetical protein N2376_07130, partial [Clostridia bacterium]|nr:hypothetical protein [Clostridia bacterium]